MRAKFGLARKAVRGDDFRSGSRCGSRRLCNTPDDLYSGDGGLAEDHVNGGLLGELFFTVMQDQFTRLRDGDRFWYQSYLPQSLVKKLERQQLSEVVRRNTPIAGELQGNVFRVPNQQ